MARRRARFAPPIGGPTFSPILDRTGITKVGTPAKREFMHKGFEKQKIHPHPTRTNRFGVRGK